MKLLTSIYAVMALATIVLASPMASAEEGLALKAREKYASPTKARGRGGRGGHAAPSGGIRPSGGYALPTGSPGQAETPSEIDSSTPFSSAKITGVAIQATKAKTTKASKTKTTKGKATTSPTGGAEAPEADPSAAPGSGAGDDPPAVSPPATTPSGTKKPAAGVTGTKTTPSGTSAPVSGGTGGSGGGGLPAASGTSVLAAAQTITGSFDGGMKMFDRGKSCTGQAEGGDADAVFILQKGASLSNVIIGPNQVEGVHCQGACTLTNVWWSAVCEDAFTVKVQAAGETTTIKGGGAFGAADKVIQHNGGGTISISNFVVNGFGKLYRSCGNCKESAERHVICDRITATDGSELVGINPNFGDTAKITNSVLKGVKDVCTEYKGTSSGSEPSKVGSGVTAACQYGSDVTVS